jgi:hypothetical protein
MGFNLASVIGMPNLGGMVNSYMPNYGSMMPSMPAMPKLPKMTDVISNTLNANPMVGGYGVGGGGTSSNTTNSKPLVSPINLPPLVDVKPGFTKQGVDYPNAGPTGNQYYWGLDRPLFKSQEEANAWQAPASGQFNATKPAQPVNAWGLQTPAPTAPTKIAPQLKTKPVIAPKTAGRK